MLSFCLDSEPKQITLGGFGFLMLMVLLKNFFTKKALTKEGRPVHL